MQTHAGSVHDEGHLMTDTTVGLRELHRLLLKLRDVRDDLDRGPKQITARENLLKRAEVEWDEKREALKQAKAAADRKSLDLKTNEGKLKELQAKLNAVTTNKEFDILRGQMEADNMANSVLEDEILEALDGVDRLQAEIGEAEKRVEHAKTALQKKTAAVAAAEPDLRSDASHLEAKVGTVDGFLAGDVRQKYTRLVSAYGADALAPVDGKVCTSCYTSVTPQSKVLLNSGDIVFCSCGRLLYLPE